MLSGGRSPLQPCCYLNLGPPQRWATGASASLCPGRARQPPASQPPHLESSSASGAAEPAPPCSAHQDKQGFKKGTGPCMVGGGVCSHDPVERRVGDIYWRACVRRLIGPERKSHTRHGCCGGVVVVQGCLQRSRGVVFLPARGWELLCPIIPGFRPAGLPRIRRNGQAQNWPNIGYRAYREFSIEYLVCL